MAQSLAEILAPYDYELPTELIAQSPASPRDSARLVVLDRATGNVEWSTFRQIADFLPEKTLLVLNTTKVIPARLFLSRATGGQVAALIVGAESGQIRVLANRSLKESEVLFGHGFTCTVKRRVGKEWLLVPSFPLGELPAILQEHGRMPLPPYIKSDMTEPDLRDRYQSVFAKEEGSIAAPTASLHFTPELLVALEERGVRFATVTLHVHLGTFSPLTEEQWQTGQLHEEWYEIEPEQQRAIEEAKKDGYTIMPVGTTAARTLESAADENGQIIQPHGTTRLFIREGYRFRLTQGLITNFHVPKSSLLMLVSAFAGRERVLDVYRQAIERRLRFFSFGDAMLVR